LAASGVTATGANLAWTAATDDVAVAGYQVLRDGVVVGAPTATTFTDTGLTPATTYQYTVRALDTSGNVGPTAALAVTTLPAAGGPLYAATFDGADGAAWPAAWTTSTAAGGTAALQGGAGRLAFGTASGSYARAQLTGLAARADADVTFSYQWRDAAAKGYLGVTLRGSGGWSGAYRPATGYGLELSSTSTSLVLRRTVNGTATDLQTVPNAQAIGSAEQWVRLRVVGSTIQVKTWLDGQAEPLAWRATLTDTSVTAAGQVFLSYVRSSSATAARAVDVDDVRVTAG
jgi:hypothetical protein